MKNRLENEYRKLMQNETPDLWNRIEEGIENTVQEQPECGTVNKIKNKAGRKRFMLPIAACAAACICIPAVVTGVFTLPAENNGKYFEESPQENIVTGEVAADCAEEEKPAEEACEEQPEAGQEAVKEEFAEYKCEDSAADLLTDGTTSGREESEKLRNDYDNEKQASASQEASLIFHIREVFSEEIVYSENNPAGTVYRIREEMQGNCTVYVPSGVDWTVEAGKVYEAVEAEEDLEYDYELVQPVE